MKESSTLSSLLFDTRKSRKFGDADTLSCEIDVFGCFSLSPFNEHLFGSLRSFNVTFRLCTLNRLIVLIVKIKLNHTHYFLAQYHFRRWPVLTFISCVFSSHVTLSRAFWTNWTSSMLVILSYWNTMSRWRDNVLFFLAVKIEINFRNCSERRTQNRRLLESFVSFGFLFAVRRHLIARSILLFLVSIFCFAINLHQRTGEIIGK